MADHSMSERVGMSRDEGLDMADASYRARHPVMVTVRKDDLLRALEFVEAHHGELATSWYWGFRAVKEREAE